MDRVVIVGASLAGLRAAESLRQAGYTGTLTLIGAEPEAPYNRPPLSKQVLLGEQTADQVLLREDEVGEALTLDLLLGTRATRIDPAGRTVRLHNGREIPYDGLVIATGARAHQLPNPLGLSGIHTLRTLDDAVSIRTAFESTPRVTVVGAGFIGAEVASAARRHNLEVTVIEETEVPLERVLGVRMGAVCAGLHADHGTRLRTGVRVTGFRGRGPVEAVILSDGSEIPTDLVVVGVGAAPATEWLSGSGLSLEDGVVCDATGATNLPHVYAAGDVARWQHPRFDYEPVRIEHWTHAASQGAAVARSLLAPPGQAAELSAMPYFWTDQYGLRIQFAGRPDADAEVRVVDGSIDERRFVALYRAEEDLAGVLAFGSPRPFLGYRRLLESGSTWEQALANASVSTPS